MPGEERPVEFLSGETAKKYMEEYMDSGIALLEIGPEIRVIYASCGLYRMLGRSKKSLAVPCGLKEVGIHPDYVADYEEVLRAGAGKEGAADHVHRISGNGKDWIWRHVRAVRVAYPGRKYPVMLELSTDVSELIKTERALRISNERLRVAFRQLPHILWEVDLEERTFSIYNVDEQKCQQDTKVRDFPEAFLDRHIVHPDSASDFGEFAKNLLSGRSAGRGNFIMRDGASSGYGWVAMSYRMIYDEEGRPLKAVGIQSKFPGMSGIGTGVMQRRPLPETVNRHLISRMKANLTRNTVEEIWLNGRDQTAWTWEKNYEDIIDFEERYLFQQHGKSFVERFQRERLLQSYEEGEIWSAKEYQRVDEAGGIRWIMDLVNLVKDERSGDICIYTACLDSQIRHDWENLIKEEAAGDRATGLYTMRTVKAMAKTLIRKKGKGSCALSLIRIIGEKRSGKTRRFLAAALSMALGMDCVVGQYSPETILAFIPDAGSRFDVKRRIEDAFAYLRISMTDVPEIGHLRFLAGTVLGQNPSADYDDMLIRAGFLCDMGKNMAVDTVLFPTEEEDWDWASLRRGMEESKIAVLEDEAERPLTKEEQTAAFQCVTDMLSARSLDTSMEDALRDLGRYYNAARTYLLKLSTDKQTVDMAYEWISRGKRSIRQVMQGTKLRKIPLLSRCFREGTPVMMESPGAVLYASAGQKKWHFIAYPLKRGGEVTGFLCVENAKNHGEDLVLLVTLAPYITGEEKRFEQIQGTHPGSGKDLLTTLPNLKSYMDVVYSLNSDSYSSMGAVAVDVPNYSLINSSYGFAYGKKMLTYIAETLTSVFGPSHVFRIWDAEFVVLFPNTIQEVFEGRCARMSTMIQRRYPRQVRIGHIWGEGIFSARKMIKEAQEIMRNENVKEAPGGKEGLYEEHEPKHEVSQQSFVPYFQPKIDMRDGSLIGAEALARGIGEDGTIVPPARFIEKMEQDGSIRKLDLFMLEMALRQLCEWKKKNYPVIQVSVNISRVTLFHSSAFASILAIQSRYPEIPAEKIELEITETAGDVERATLAEVMDRFLECGIQFELDDFGAGYANIALFSSAKFRTVKLDRSLVSDLPDNEVSSMMVENITQICENFGVNCIAEGVETKRQAEALIEAGCVYGQGFYFAKPLAAHEFEKKYFTGKG